ncbi:MAG: cation:proton antiporter [Nanoarchaeota archaeon]|nr:cation:proton antiporter [Nanoarchaeota archaeon]
MALDLFLELSIVIIAALLIALITVLLKQPMIIGYIIAGLIIGPAMFNFVGQETNIGIFAKLGVTLLLFTVGLNLNPKSIKEVGKVAIIAGIVQIVFIFLVSLFISRLLGFTILTSAYIGVALAFSSTIVVMKLLSDKTETESLHGRIAMGILIVQDIVAVIILLLISSFAGKSQTLTSIAFNTFFRGASLLIILFFIGFYLLPPLTKFAAKSQELLLLFSLAWCLALASLFYYFGFSVEIGALLAGVTLSLSPYRYEMSSRLKPIRDFFLLIFFIILGSQITFVNLNQYVGAILAFAAIIFIGKPLIITLVMGIMGYTKRNSFLSGLALSQISEFSFIIIALGVSFGHIPITIIPLITIIGLITIAGSSYEILYSNAIYNTLSKYLSLFEKRGKKVDETKYHGDNTHEIILFGYNRIGYDLLESIKKLKRNYLVVDYNPTTIIKLAKEGVECRYGDADDAELLDELNVTKSKMIISTIPDFDTNLLLISKIRETNKTSVIIAVSHQIEEAIKLYEQGATYVITPHFLGAHHTSSLIEEYGLNMNKFLQEKKVHLKNLKSRRERGQEHPRYDIERKL